MLLLIFLRATGIPRLGGESAYTLPEFLKPFVDGSVQLLSQFARFVGVLGGKELMNQGGDRIGQVCGSCTVVHPTNGPPYREMGMPRPGSTSLGAG